MPLYEYECESHGLFDLIRPASEFDAPGACPACGENCVRIMSVPNVRTLGPLKRNAMERNEKSRHEPHVCTSGCGHHHAPSKPMPRNTLKEYTGPRPWVMEHR